MPFVRLFLILSAFIDSMLVILAQGSLRVRENPFFVLCVFMMILLLFASVVTAMVREPSNVHKDQYTVGPSSNAESVTESAHGLLNALSSILGIPDFILELPKPLSSIGR